MDKAAISASHFSDGRSVNVMGQKNVEELSTALAVVEVEAACRRAEVAEERANRLQMVTAALSQARMPIEVAEAIVSQGVDALMASGGAVALLDETTETFELIHTVGYPIEVMAQWKYFAWDAPVAMAEVVRTHQPVWVESLEERDTRFPMLGYDNENFILQPFR